MRSIDILIIISIITIIFCLIITSGGCGSCGADKRPKREKYATVETTCADNASSKQPNVATEYTLGKPLTISKYGLMGTIDHYPQFPILYKVY